MLFEYLVMTYDNDKQQVKIKSKPDGYQNLSVWKTLESDTTFSILGQDQWELVSSSPISNYRCTYELCLFFKRKIG